MGLSKFRRNGVEHITLRPGHHTKNIQELKGISPRIILCIVQLNNIPTIKITQAHGPISGHPEEEVKSFNEDLNDTRRQIPTTHDLIIGDFTAKLGRIGNSSRSLRQWTNK